MTRSRSGRLVRSFRMKKNRALCRMSLPLAVALAQGLVVSTLPAQNVEHISQREISRRQAQQAQGSDELAIAQQAMKEKKYALAHDHFRIAVVDFHDSPVSG